MIASLLVGGPWPVAFAIVVTFVALVVVSVTHDRRGPRDALRRMWEAIRRCL